MDWLFSSDPNVLLTWLAVVLVVAFGLAFLLMLWIILQVRRINLPPDADFATTLRATPFVVVLMLDLLDLSLDFLSAPIAWVVLSRVGLKGLRGVTVVESIIPGTQLIPTMTLAWIIVRLAGPRFKF